MESRLLDSNVGRTSKKRVFTWGSSIDPDVLIIPPPVNQISKSKFRKTKEVMNHEIIDVDTDKDHSNIMHIEGKVDKHNKGMLIKHEIIDVDANEDYDDIMVIEGKTNKHTKAKEAMTIRSLVTSGNMDGGFVDGDRSSKKRYAPGLDYIINLDGGSDLYYVEEDMGMHNEHQLSGDEHELLPYISNDVATESNFKNLNSSFLSPVKNKTMVTTTRNSSESISKPQPDVGGLLLGSEASNALRNRKITKKKSTGIIPPVGTRYHAVDIHKAGLFPFGSSGDTALQNKVGDVSEYLESNSQFHAGYGKKSSVYGSTRNYSLSNRLTNTEFIASVNSYSSSHMHKVERGTRLTNLYPIAADPSTSENNPINLEKNVNNFEFRTNLLRHRNHHEQRPLQVHSSKEQTLSEKVYGLEKDVNEGEVLKKFKLFKTFDIVQDPSDHHYVNCKSSVGQPSRSWLKKVQEEWNILEKHLPDGIFVRVYESRMDLMRAVIVGAEGTPYHNGLFFFDVFFPTNYPHEPPCMHYQSWGIKVNPHLYRCGKICISLLAIGFPMNYCSWSLESTMLQVLVSIQGLVLTADPYYSLRKQMQKYWNFKALFGTLQTMAYTMIRPPKHFKDFVVGHFYTHAQEILVAHKACMDGGQQDWWTSIVKLGALINNYIDYIDPSLSSLSKLDDRIPLLIRAFAQIGVEDCKQYIRQVETKEDDEALNKQRQRVLEGDKMSRKLVAGIERSKAVNKQRVEYQEWWSSDH